MTTFVSTLGASLTGFTASDLPTGRWMKLILSRMRLRVRAEHRDFVSSAVKVDGQSLDETNLASVHWPWNDDGRPFLVGDQKFEIEVERRFLLRYKCIRRTKPTSIGQLRTCHSCAVPLYDGSAKMLEDSNRIEIGEITFTLQSDASGEDRSLTRKASTSTCTVYVNLHKEQKQFRWGVFWRR